MPNALFSAELATHVDLTLLSAFLGGDVHIVIGLLDLCATEPAVELTFLLRLSWFGALRLREANESRRYSAPLMPPFLPHHDVSEAFVIVYYLLYDTVVPLGVALPAGRALLTNRWVLLLVVLEIELLLLHPPLAVVPPHDLPAEPISARSQRSSFLREVQVLLHGSLVPRSFYPVIEYSGIRIENLKLLEGLEVGIVFQRHVELNSSVYSLLSLLSELWWAIDGNLAELLVSVLGIGFGDEDISLRVLFQLPDSGTTLTNELTN